VGDGDQLVVDREPAATIALPEGPLHLTGVDSLKWSDNGGSVIAVVI
jgi:hypothetical protein